MKKPQHIALIMDGNGRWAVARGKTRTQGHKKGAEVVKKVIEAAQELEIPYLTLFSFSSENWNRPLAEVNDLMGLLRYYLKREVEEIHKKGICLRVIGERERLDKDIVERIEYAENRTKDNTKMVVTIALSYGGRQEIVHTAKKLCRSVENGELSIDAINEDIFTQSLMTSDTPDPDLLIRTSGEKRISNFLLWQLAYAELYFTDTLWPDFSKEDLEEAIDFYSSRERRYGGLKK